MSTFDLVFEGGGAKGTAFIGTLEASLRRATRGRICLWRLAYACR